ADIFTLTTSSRFPVFSITLLLVALLANWSCDYANVMERIGGSWLALTHCATNKDKLHVGMLPRRTSMIASRLRMLFVAKTLLYVKKSLTAVVLITEFTRVGHDFLIPMFFGVIGSVSVFYLCTQRILQPVLRA